MPDTQADDGPELDLVIDGQKYTAEDLTFREQREMRRVLKTELMDDPSADVSEANVSDFYLAMIYVIKRRENDALSLDDVLDMKLADVLKERPTQAAPKRGAKAKA